MTISYNWLSTYLPFTVTPDKLSNILTSVGLEVESLEKFEEIKGGLKGLVVGEVISCEKHPEADKLSITKVDIGKEVLQIVCGAPNVTIGQKVVVAPIGTTIHPIEGDSLTMKKAKIRGVESFGMICAEDEIGLGKSHAGILVLDNNLLKGSILSDHFNPGNDFIYEIGLTPNRMNAMSHIGVAKDICAWFNHHENANVQIKSPLNKEHLLHSSTKQILVDVPDREICPRYSGVCISGLKVGASPKWLTERLNSIGLKSINNIVDVTNFILHETGQPLHAFDLENITNQTIIVQQLPEGTPFITLDDKERKLSAEDIMICDGNNNPLCIGGVFGGKNSGVKETTTAIFLESANFNPTLIRKTLVRHGLRTDAAVRFEKGVDISQTVEVLQRAATLIIQVAGGEVSSEIIDLYPKPKIKTEVTLNWDYLTKLSGKDYDHKKVGTILQSLGFEIISNDDNAIIVKVPFTNPDISIPADIVEEIMRIDGLDNIAIPEVICIAPGIEKMAFENNLKEKIAGYLIANGFSEILTNSITNSAYFDEQQLGSTIKILNSLSVELDVMKPQMIQTALECIAYNINRKNNNLFLFEFGKTYRHDNGSYAEQDHLMIYISSNEKMTSWKDNSSVPDLFYLKGLMEKIAQLSGLNQLSFVEGEDENMTNVLDVTLRKTKLGNIGNVGKNILSRFSVKQPVLSLSLNWAEIIKLAKNKKIIFEEISKYPAVFRELSIVVDKEVTFDKIQKTTRSANIPRLSASQLLNVFESERIGVGKKSLAMSYTFFDKEKTLTDKEIDSMMNRLMNQYENELGAQIRRG